MEKYKVEIEETLNRVVEVDAENEDEAYMKVKEMYKNCEIVLMAEDFVDVEISVLDSHI
jgi:hypothetical protein